jgi:uncharacterized membrane protein YciS (DUF1049 family)
MHILRNILLFLIALAMLALGALFAVQNDVAVPLDLLVVYLPARSVALWVLLALALGGILGLLVSLGMILRLRTRLAAAHRRLERKGTPEVPVQKAGK